MAFSIDNLTPIEWTYPSVKSGLERGLHSEVKLGEGHFFVLPFKTINPIPEKPTPVWKDSLIPMI